MRILVLAQYFSHDMGGGSTRASNVVNGLLSNGCDVTVVAAFLHYPRGNVPARAFFGVWMLQIYAVSRQIMTNIAFASIAFILIEFFLLSTAITLYVITRITKKMNGNN